MNRYFYRKARSQNHPDHSALSGKWRAISNLIGRGMAAEALTQLNAAMASGGDDLSKAETLCFVGDVYFSQGRHDQAVTAYQKAGTYSAQWSNWLRPMIGQARSQIGMGLVNDADTTGTAAVTLADSRLKTYNQLLLSLQAQPGATSLIPPRPTTPAEVASRLGSLFFAEGEVPMAKKYWQQATTLAPNGAIKARIGLAEIARRQGDHVQASQMATQALQVGRFGAKTLSAWRVLLAANHQQGIDSVAPSLLAGLQQVKAGVRARGMLLLASELRGLNNPAWLDIVQRALVQDAGNARVAAELRKLVLASQVHQTAPPNSRLTSANNLRNTPQISLNEWLFGAKSTAEANLALGQAVDVNTLIQEGAGLFGNDAVGSITHALALTCVKVGHPEKAQPLFEGNISTLAPSSIVRAKSIWSLAKMHDQAGRYLAAANFYQLYTQLPSISARMAIYGKVAWVRCVFKSGNQALVESSAPELRNLLNQVDDYELALDISRQLMFAPQAIHVLAQDYLHRGEALATSKLATTTVANVACTTLFRLARRQNEFGEYNAVITRWTALGSDTLAWLWSQKSDFWSYLAEVMTAYDSVGNLPAVKSLANTYTADLATPPSAKAVLLVSLGLILINHRELQSGLEKLNQAIVASPNHELCAYTYYWQAVVALASSDPDTAKNLASRILQVVGEPSTMGWKVELVIRAYCVIADLDPAKVERVQNRFSSDDAAKQIVLIRADLNKINS